MKFVATVTSTRSSETTFLVDVDVNAEDFDSARDYWKTEKMAVSKVMQWLIDNRWEGLVQRIDVKPVVFFI